jgi:hypothetical protein
MIPKRSRNEVIADIAQQLSPLSKGEPDVISAIRLHIELVNQQKDVVKQLTRVTDIRKAADAAKKSLTALKRADLGFGDQEFTNILIRIESRIKATGPDPRSNPFHFLCANQAFALIRECSRKRAVSSESGNAHLIAQLIYEAVTGKGLEATELLRTVRDVKRWRDADPPVGTKV